MAAVLRLAGRRATTVAATAATPTTAAAAAAAAVSASAPFSTTAPVLGLNANKSKIEFRRQLGVNKKKSGKQRVAPGRAPEPGERKAMRKRIVLSNGNALEVPGLVPLTADVLLGRAPAATAAAEPPTPPTQQMQPTPPMQANAATSSIARMYALPDILVDQLRAAEAFKTNMSFHLFRRPATLVRRETVALTTALQTAAAGQQTLRLVVDGDRIAGKSTLLLQALAYGYLNDWVVLHIPEAFDITSGATEYAPTATTPVQYVQPAYVYRLLQATLAANARVLAQHTTVRAYDRLINTVAAGATLQTLVAAARESEQAWPVFRALWWELTSPEACAAAAQAGTPRPPLLLALDGLAHVMGPTAYLSPDATPIHAHDLALVRVLVDALGGATPLPAGGAVLAATSYGNAPTNVTLALSLAQRLAEQEPAATTTATPPSSPSPPIPSRSPFVRYDDRVAAVLQSVRVLRLHGVDRTEARALMEYWAASGLVRDRIDEQAVASTWTVAGHGVVGEMERTALRTMRL